jgi:hypothetical protein
MQWKHSVLFFVVNGSLFDGKTTLIVLDVAIEALNIL